MVGRKEERRKNFLEGPERRLPVLCSCCASARRTPGQAGSSKALCLRQPRPRRTRSSPRRSHGIPSSRRRGRRRRRSRRGRRPRASCPIRCCRSGTRTTGPRSHSARSRCRGSSSRRSRRSRSRESSGPRRRSRTQTRPARGSGPSGRLSDWPVPCGAPMRTSSRPARISGSSTSRSTPGSRWRRRSGPATGPGWGRSRTSFAPRANGRASSSRGDATRPPRRRRSRSSGASSTCPRTRRSPRPPASFRERRSRSRPATKRSRRRSTRRPRSATPPRWANAPASRPTSRSAGRSRTSSSRRRT